MPAPIRLYNTASHAVEPVKPVAEGELSVYVCGMTVYDHAHVGHARAMIVFDALVRWLRAQGWRVRFVRNFTDIDDKIIRRAEDRGTTAAELAQHFIDAFHEDCDALSLVRPDAEPRVTESIAAIQAMITELIAQGHAYPSEGSVWFDVASDPNYGALSRQRPEHMLAGADPEPGKRHPADFALWKAAREGEPSWESPWGAGRPGWHIECSTMVREHLGTTIDIHGGGVDLVFPHHENELAQSCCANHVPYVRHWVHNGLITRPSADGSAGEAAKMGKSLSNAVNIRDMLALWPAEALRLYYLQAHYRAPLPWTDTSLDEALSMLARLYEARAVAASLEGDAPADEVAQQLGPDAQAVLDHARAFPQNFTAALNDDFHTPKALSAAFELARAVNRLGNHKQARKRAGSIGQLAIEALDQLRVLGLLALSPDAFHEQVKEKRLAALGLDRTEVEALIAERIAARAARDWARSDAIRDQLVARRIVLMDCEGGGCNWKIDLLG